MKRSTLILNVVALSLLCGLGKAVQPSAFFARVTSRSVLIFGRGFETSSPTDVKLTDVNEASCDLSLKAHSDRVLSEVKDPTLFVTKVLSESDKVSNFLEHVVSESDKVSNFFEQLEKYKKSLESHGCNPTSMRFSVHVSFGDETRIPTTTYFTMELPLQSQLPIFTGKLDKTCRVVARGRAKRLILRNMDMYGAEETVHSEDAFDSTAMVLNYGAQGILLDVNDEAVVDMYTLLSCENSIEIGPQYIHLQDSVKVGHIRELLASEDIGIQQNRARSFMVIGFHPSDF